MPAAVVDADDAELAEPYSEIDAEDQDIAALPADLRFRIVKHDVEIVTRGIKACFVNRTLTNARTAANEFQAKLDSYELPPEAAENLTWLANRKTFLVVLDELAMRESELDQLVFEVKAAYKRHDYKGCCEKALLAKAICTDPRGYEEEYKTSNNRWRQIQDKWGEADAMSRSRRWHEVMVVCDEILELQQFNEDAKKLRQHARGILVNRRKVRRLVIVAVFVAIIGAVVAGAIRWVPAMLDSMRYGKVMDKIDIAYEDARSRSNLGENLTRSDVDERLREALVLLAKLDEMQLQPEQRAEFEKTSQHVKAYQEMSKQLASIEAFIAQAQQAITELNDKVAANNHLSRASDLLEDVQATSTAAGIGDSGEIDAMRLVQWRITRFYDAFDVDDVAPVEAVMSGGNQRFAVEIDESADARILLIGGNRALQSARAAGRDDDEAAVGQYAIALEHFNRTALIN